jgi:hypothetical protein
MLGTGFFVSSDGKVVTPHHVVGGNDENLKVILSPVTDINTYQDLSNTECKVTPAAIVEVDPARDVAILATDLRFGPPYPFTPLGSFDHCNVGDQLEVIGYPHCNLGRRALTLQRAEIGAKVIQRTNNVPSKHGVLNIQARPGQSGSLVQCPQRRLAVGMLIGAWVPNNSGISLGGINPFELHQTTHCISAEHIQRML